MIVASGGAPHLTAGLAEILLAWIDIVFDKLGDWLFGLGDMIFRWAIRQVNKIVIKFVFAGVFFSKDPDAGVFFGKSDLLVGSLNNSNVASLIYEFDTYNEALKLAREVALGIVVLAVFLISLSILTGRRGFEDFQGDFLKIVTALVLIMLAGSFYNIAVAVRVDAGVSVLLAVSGSDTVDQFIDDYNDQIERAIEQGARELFANQTGASAGIKKSLYGALYAVLGIFFLVFSIAGPIILGIKNLIFLPLIGAILPVGIALSTLKSIMPLPGLEVGDKIISRLISKAIGGFFAGLYWAIVLLVVKEMLSPTFISEGSTIWKLVIVSFFLMGAGMKLRDADNAISDMAENFGADIVNFGRLAGLLSAGIALPVMGAGALAMGAGGLLSGLGGLTGVGGLARVGGALGGLGRWALTAPLRPASSAAAGVSAGLAGLRGAAAGLGELVHRRPLSAAMTAARVTAATTMADLRSRLAGPAANLDKMVMFGVAPAPLRTFLLAKAIKESGQPENVLTKRESFWQHAERLADAGASPGATLRALKLAEADVPAAAKIAARYAAAGHKGQAMAFWRQYVSSLGKPHYAAQKSFDEVIAGAMRRAVESAKAADASAARAIAAEAGELASAGRAFIDKGVVPAEDVAVKLNQTVEHLVKAKVDPERVKVAMEQLRPIVNAVAHKVESDPSLAQRPEVRQLIENVVKLQVEANVTGSQLAVERAGEVASAMRPVLTAASSGVNVAPQVVNVVLREAKSMAETYGADRAASAVANALNTLNANGALGLSRDQIQKIADAVRSGQFNVNIQ